MLSEKLIQLAVDTALLKDMVLFLAHKNYCKIITLVSVLNGQLKDAIGEVRSIVQAGQQRRESKELIYGPQLVELFEALKKKAEVMGCKMIWDLYETCSHVRTRGITAALGIHPVSCTAVYYHKFYHYSPDRKNDFIAMIPYKNAKTNYVVPPH